MTNANTAVEVEAVQFGETIFTETGFPIMEIKVGEKKGYLSPFRGTHFQVSGDTKGRGDFGSSDFIKMTDLRGTAYKENVLFAYAYMAIMRFGRYGKELGTASIRWNDEKHLRNFVIEVAKWLEQL